MAAGGRVVERSLERLVLCEVLGGRKMGCDGGFEAPFVRGQGPSQRWERLGLPVSKAREGDAISQHASLRRRGWRLGTACRRPPDPGLVWSPLSQKILRI